jgi:hypothetical protein
LWIHRSVAAELDSKDATDIRSGFRTALFNARGAHWVDPSGAEELKLEDSYRKKADNAEEAGFHRLASVLRELADEYKREAQQVATRARVDR